MKEKFETADGLRLIGEALLEQEIVQGDPSLAAELAAKGRLAEYDVGEAMVVQGGNDNDIFFLLIGEVEITVNGRPVANRHQGEVIGEMAILTPTALRSATVSATKQTVALRMAEPDFAQIAERFGKIWKVIARVVSDRLRQREQFHRKPNEVPVLFIGSSTEGLAVTNEIVNGLQKDRVIPRPWSMPGVFSPGGVAADVLMKEVDSSDFAVFVFGPDDRITSRKKEYMAPRDNVVFELGMFMGRLTRDRAFLIKERTSDVKVPSDLLGILPITYAYKARRILGFLRRPNTVSHDLAESVAPVCAELRRIISKLGPR